MSGRKTVLFVDDEEVVRSSFIRELEQDGFTVTGVGDGRGAVVQLEKRRFDLVITDLMMPDFDGFAVLKSVKRLQPRCGVIVLTGFGDMTSAIDALRLGADDFMLKPCDIEELLFRIGRCLDKQHLVSQLAEQNRSLQAEIERRQEAEQKVAENEQRMRMALDASSNGVWDRNLVTGEVSFSKNWHQTFGYQGEMCIRDNATWEQLIHPEDREAAQALRQEHVLGKTPWYEAEFRIKNSTGQWQWILSRGQVVERDRQGRAVRLMGTHTDITRLKQAEEALLQARAELEQRVAARTAELSETNTALTVLLRKRERDKEELEEQVMANVGRLVDPFLARLEATRLTQQQRVLIGILRANLGELTSPFASNLSSRLARLTPAELQIANMVKLGKRTKEIAELMHLSPGTVNIHRKNIRKKLGLTHQKINLQSVLTVHT